MLKKSHFQPDQVEKIEQLGSHLRAVRQARKIPLEQISTETRISLRLLQAIEQKELEVLPQSIYLKGLLKRYAEALELNGDEIANQLPAGDTLAGITPTWKNVRFSKHRSFPGYFVYVVALVASISGASYWLGRNPSEVAQTSPSQQSAPTTKPKNETKLAEKPAPNPEQSAPKATPVSNVQPPSGQPVVVDMTLKDDCWLQVVADGKTTFEGTLQKGEQRKWEAKQELVIRAGNAGGVVIAYNNEQAKPLGQPGAVETVTYQASGDREATQGG
ncbi:RodZ domain-containing protein [Oscillatoria sp. FACHB-1406]|uniref:RodZ domain-containing protein n=1 Tax=Oscillatoria sp. FACHB-1406 TaxID=2692846 RepID=UPI001683B61D|nr:RodZ domain-containing protein [Oscillatoria sp. FACHB-1406]MBD2579753.1 helix-turn-helix domain-containing protein [Oscillatoria sp. FACHB-1406]